MSPGLNPVLASTHEFEQFIDSQRRNLSPGNQQRVQSKKSDSRNAARMQSGRRVAQYESAPRTQSWSGGTDDTLLTVSGRSAEHTTDRIAQRSALASSFIPSSASSSSSSSALSSKSSRASLRDVELQEDPYGWLRGAAPASTSTYGIAKDMPAPVLPANADNVAARRRHHARRGFEVRGPEQSWDIYYSYHERQKPGKEKEDWDFLDESKSPSASSSSSSSTNSNSSSRGRPDDILRYGHNHLAGHLLDPQPQTERPAQTLDSALIKLLAPTSPHGHDYGHSRDGDGDGDGDGSPSFPRPVQHSRPVPDMRSYERLMARTLKGWHAGVMDRMREMQLRAQHTSLKNRRAAAHRALALWWAETRGRALAHREQELRQRQPLHVCARVAGHKRCHGARRALWALRALVIAAKDAQWQEQRARAHRDRWLLAEQWELWVRYFERARVECQLQQEELRRQERIRSAMSIYAQCQAQQEPDYGSAEPAVGTGAAAAKEEEGKERPEEGRKDFAFLSPRPPTKPRPRREPASRLERHTTVDRRGLPRATAAEARAAHSAAEARAAERRRVQAERRLQGLRWAFEVDGELEPFVSSSSSSSNSSSSPSRKVRRSGRGERKEAEEGKEGDEEKKKKDEEEEKEAVVNSGRPMQQQASRPSLLERQRLIRKQATERVTKRREADAEVALQRAREQDLALRALQEEHRACLEAAQRVAKHRRRLARGDAAELKRQVQRAQDYRHAQQLVRCGLAPWLRLMAMAREAQTKAVLFRRDCLQQQAWGALFGLWEEARRRDVLLERRGSAVARAYRCRSLVRRVWYHWRLCRKALKQRARAVMGHFARFSRAAKGFRAWKVSLERTRRSKVLHLRVVVCQGDACVLRHSWHRWRAYTEEAELDREVQLRANATWARVQGWLK